VATACVARLWRSVTVRGVVLDDDVFASDQRIQESGLLLYDTQKMSVREWATLK
jgi:hypothetical protein